jgi:hypothetical protein
LLFFTINSSAKLIVFIPIKGRIKNILLHFNSLHSCGVSHCMIPHALKAITGG